MNDRRNTCPSWCEWGGHKPSLDPHRASVGTIEAPGFTAEMVVRQYEPLGRVTPPVEVAVELDTTTPAGRPTGRHSLVIPLPGDVDVVAFLADSDHEDDVVLYGGVRDHQGRPLAYEPPRGRAEDHRVRLARETLAESEADRHGTHRGYDAGWWHGRLEATVQMLLEIFDESTPDRRS